MYKSIIILFITAILLFFIGYNFTFNTDKTIAKYLSLSQYKEGSNLYKLLTSQSNVFWMKITGYGIILFALILVILGVILIYKKV